MTKSPCPISLSSATTLQASRKWQLNETLCAAIGAFQEEGGIVPHHSPTLDFSIRPLDSSDIG